MSKRASGAHLMLVVKRSNWEIRFSSYLLGTQRVAPKAGSFATEDALATGMTNLHPHTAVRGIFISQTPPPSPLAL